jgi:exosome complex exonuclease DIS3/RRP44
MSTPIQQIPYGHPHPQFIPGHPGLQSPAYAHPQVVLGQEDVLRIAAAVKQALQDEISQLVESEVARAVEPLHNRIDNLEQENKNLFHQLDELEQYGRRSLVRVSGIPEHPDENTSTLLIEATKKAGIPLQPNDIEVSHRVGKPNNRSGTGSRQIIARLKSVDLKFRLIKNWEKFKKHPDTRQISVNEDLTKYRDKLMYNARQLSRNRRIKQVWSSNGKIRIRDLNDKVFLIKQESDLIPFGHVI